MKLLKDLQTAEGSLLYGAMGQTDYFFYASVAKMKEKKSTRRFICVNKSNFYFLCEDEGHNFSSI